MRLLQKLGISLCSEPIGLVKGNPDRTPAEREAEKNTAAQIASKVTALAKVSSHFL